MKRYLSSALATRLTRLKEGKDQRYNGNDQQRHIGNVAHAY